LKKLASMKRAQYLQALSGRATITLMILEDNTELRIDITESDLRDNFEPDNYYTTFEIFFENCEDSEFRELIDKTGQAMLTAIFKDENIDYQIYSTENNDLHDLFNNMRG
jgi:hypothetical protein